MRLFVRVLVVLTVFIGVGVLSAKVVAGHAAAGSAPLPQIRLAAGMAGLFAGGAAATIAVLVLAFRQPR